jgi:hypothetical protein
MTSDEKIRFGMMALAGSATIATSILGVHVGLLDVVGGVGST